MQQAHWLKDFSNPIISGNSNKKRFEVAVIGGGYSGLSAAIFLAQQGVETVLIEKYYCGYGASGRNAGHLTPTIGKDIPSLLMVYGKKRAQELIHFAEQSVSFTESIIQNKSISCDYVQSGNLMAAVTNGQLKRLEKSARIAENLGVDIEWIDTNQSNLRGVPPAFLGGILENKGGTLHPGKYLLALKSQALAAGVHVLEGTTVHRYDKNGTYFLETSSGQYEVNKMVLATNGYLPLHPFINQKTVPLSVTLLETEPLNKVQMEAIRWHGREGIYTGHEILESYRLSAQNTIVAGSKMVTHRLGYQNLDTPGTNDHAIITEALHQRFPELSLKVAHYWSGTIAFTIDFLPVIRKLDADITTACAYAGHGVAMASYGGTLAAEMLISKPLKPHFITTRRVISLPPRFMLSPLIQLIVWILSRIDRKADRKLQQKNKKANHTSS
jgi:gamma-glutamylputrescine oxidase